MRLALFLLLSSTALAQSMPDPALTPGKTRDLDKATICNTKWGLDRRFVTKAMKEQVCKAYGLEDAYCFGHHPNPKTGKPEPNVEFDHWIPRELGGADDPANLWPQPWDEARVKDRVENMGHKLYCAGNLPLDKAQELVKNWAIKNLATVTPLLFKNCSDDGKVWWTAREGGRCYLEDKPK